MTRSLIIVAALVGLVACDGGSSDGPNWNDDSAGGDDSGGNTSAEVCDDGADNDGDGQTDCDDSDCDGDAACIETECDDGTDNDGDGAADCDDSDCMESYAPCSWPTRVAHEFSADFAGRTVTCETWIGDFDETVDDCLTHYKSQLDEETANACPDCDRTFSGSLNYQTDTCTSQFGDDPPPTSGAFGLKFVSETTWELWGQNETSGVWEKGVELTWDGQFYTFQSVDPLNIDVDDCDNSPLYVGDLTTTLKFKAL